MKCINEFIIIVGDKTSGTQRPIQFQDMSNEFEVALWVAKHSRILNLALEIQKAKSTPITTENKSSQILNAPSNPTSTTTILQEIDQVIQGITNVILHENLYCTDYNI